MPYPFVSPSPSPQTAVNQSAFKASDTQRDDNDDLRRLEEEAQLDIHKGLLAQLEAIKNQAKGGNLTAMALSIETILTENQGVLLAAVIHLLHNGAREGIETAARRIPFEYGASFSWDLAAQEAADFVDGYAFDLVTGINETSANRLRLAMREWIDNGGDMDDLTESIRPIFASDDATERIEKIFNADRAQMIAETESTRAYAQGKIAAYTSSGLADLPPAVSPPDDSHVRCRCDVTLEKRDGIWVWVWLTARDDFVCPICRPLHEQVIGYAFQKDVPT